MDISYLNALRLAELEELLPLFPPGARILEFGAGTGQQARHFADRGFDVVALDLANSTYASERIFPVQDYDGTHIPFDDGSVDVVFSSNVLEHVENLATILAEFRRVQKPGGFGLHVLPTPAWRLWSYATGVAASFQAAAMLPFDVVQARDGQHRRELLRRDLRRVASGFIPRGHGVSAEGLSELWTFSRAAWRRTFQTHGFDVVEDRPLPFFYTGTLLLGEALPLPTRRSLSRILGSATQFYKIKARQASG